MNIGYARVSTQGQKLDRQLDIIQAAGVDIRNIYQDKITGTTKDRPELNKMLKELQPGDVVIIADLTRISRSTKDLLYIIDEIKERGAVIKSIKDTWLDTTTENPYSQFLLTIFSSLSQLERDLISSRVKEGIKAAKARGRSSGRPPKINEKSAAVITMYKDGWKIVNIAKSLNISRGTIYKILELNNLR